MKSERDKSQNKSPFSKNDEENLSQLKTTRTTLLSESVLCVKKKQLKKKKKSWRSKLKLYSI